MNNEWMIETHAQEETEALGKALAQILPLGGVVALRGDLAAGKTCFVRGMASVYATGGAVHSPTFTLVNQYGESPRLYHVDLYRLSGPDEIADLGYEELFEPDGVCAVEWAERADVLLPNKRLDVYFEHAGMDVRRIRFVDNGLLPPGWQAGMGQALVK